MSCSVGQNCMKWSIILINNMRTYNYGLQPNSSYISLVNIWLLTFNLLLFLFLYPVQNVNFIVYIRLVFYPSPLSLYLSFQRWGIFSLVCAFSCTDLTFLDHAFPTHPLFIVLIAASVKILWGTNHRNGSRTVSRKQKCVLMNLIWARH